MTSKVEQMTLVESFDARINTDGKTIHGNYRLLQPPQPAEHPGGPCIYKPDGKGGIKFESLDDPDPTFEIYL